jgi:4-hydroxybenzoate polyprenyltransferase
LNRAPTAHPTWWRVLRPAQWAHFTLLPAAGLSRPGQGPGWEGSTAAKLGLAAFCAAGLLGFAYGLNAITDRRADEDPRKNPLAGLAVPRSAWLAVAASAGLALGLAAWLGWFAATAALCSLAAGWLYSAWPRAKRVPVAGLLCNLLIFAPLLCLTLTAPAPLPAGFVGLVSVFACLLTQNQLLHELGDLAEDLRAGDLTTARWLGPGASRFSLCALGALGCAASLGLGEGIVSRVSGAALSVLAAALATLGWGHLQRTRRHHRWLCLAGGAAYFAGTMLWI